MKNLLMVIVCSMVIVSCSKKTECTSQDKSEWQNQEEFQTKLKNDGYKINEFKVTSGNCYEIYGWDKDENKVEIYFNPVDGEIVKKEMH